MWGGIVNAAMAKASPEDKPGLGRVDNATEGIGQRDHRRRSGCAMASDFLGKWTRTGDTSTKERAAQKKMLPHLLVTTTKPTCDAEHQRRGGPVEQLDWFVADE